MEDVCNFTSIIYGHGEQGDGKTYLIRSEVNDDDGFLWDVQLKDLGNYPTFASMLTKALCSNAIYDTQAGKAERFNMALRYEIEKYESKPDEQKQFVVICPKAGFYQLQCKKQVLVIDQDTILALDPATTNDEIKSAKFHWTGPNRKSRFHVGPRLTPSKIEEVLFSFEEYHAENFATILAMIGLSHLCSSKEELSKVGLNLPSLHVIGAVTTGKSRAADHFKTLLPQMLLKDGSTKLARENELTKSRIYHMLGEVRPPFVLDPPPSITKKEMSQLLDNCYQSNVRDTMNDGAEDKEVSTTFFCIWPNEEDELPRCKTTALTKMVLLKHTPHENGVSFTQIDEIEETKIFGTQKEASGFYHSIISPVDPENLLKDMKKISNSLQVELSENDESKKISEMSRVIRNHALVCAGLKHWGKCLDNKKLVKKLVKKLRLSFVTRSLPHLQMLLMKEEATRKIKLVPVNIARERLYDFLDNLQAKEFFHYVNIQSNSICVAADLFSQDDTRCLGNLADQYEANFRKEKCYFVTKSENLEWFRRGSRSYGTLRQVTGYMIPFASVPKRLKDLFRNKLQDILPNSKLPPFNGKLKRFIANAYEMQMKGEIEPFEDDVMEEIVSKIQKLEKEHLPKVLRFLNELEYEEDKELNQSTLSNEQQVEMTGHVHNRSESSSAHGSDEVTDDSDKEDSDNGQEQAKVSDQQIRDEDNLQKRDETNTGEPPKVSDQDTNVLADQQLVENQKEKVSSGNRSRPKRKCTLEKPKSQSESKSQSKSKKKSKKKLP